MRIFLDTNILLDIIEQRMPHYTASQTVLDECDQRGFEIFVAWHGLATVFYITAKKRGEPYALQMIRDLLTWATVATVGQDEAQEALGYGIPDYEDALIAAAASAANADWLITRDEAGFSKGPIAAINPTDFLRKL
ncbi:putative nucleic acid-binding protein [Prosthecobacter fusiformis]|uniref:Putative nucleic acid-binding protein n=1 Tax=Prosthecobacter fusiformis TaxID=48464 RepID=A0A4R7SR62_9BACT|nr:PIN domain-containing protein [Prosthecobacter fusiformis]TDU81175.1 putative nucleic acid-binding protein [Prosthecobacter fusiformis]